jgi:hypothetical protein
LFLPHLALRRNVIAVASVSMMEKVHQRAGEEKEERKKAEQVCSVLTKQEEACNEQKSNEHPFGTAEWVGFCIMLN